MNKTEVYNHARKRIQEIKNELKELEQEKQILMNSKNIDIRLLQESEMSFSALANEAEQLEQKIKQLK